MTARITKPRLSIEMLHKSDSAIGSLLFLFSFLFLYLFRPTEMSGNSLAYIDVVRHTSVYQSFFYPPHLLHAPIITLFHSLLSQAAACDITCSGMLHSMVWAAITILSTYMIARVVLATVAGAIATALMVLVAHGFWVFATQLEVYVPSVGCVTAATALLFTNRSRTLDVTRVIAVSVLWVLATMYHLANVFLFIPFCAFFYVTQGPSGWRQLAIISALAGSTVLTTFVVVYGLEHERWSVQSFFSWALELTNKPMTDWGSVSNLWQPYELFAAGWAQIKTLTVLPEYLTLDQTPFKIVGALISVTTLLWNAIQVARVGRAASARLYFLLLFATNFVFFAWWEPHVHKFYIPSSIPLIVLMAFAVNDVYAHTRGKLGRRMVCGGTAAMIAIVFIFNLSSILELRQSRGPDYAEAQILDRLASKKCKIYSTGHHLVALAAYFGRFDEVPIHELEREFYGVATGESVPERPIFASEECAFIPVDFLTERWYGSRMNGYLDTATWPDYIAYFLDVRPSSEGGGITYDAFELLGEGDGPPHVLVDRGRRVHGRSLSELTDIIKTEEERALKEYEADQPTQEKGDLFLAHVPRANIEIGRSRTLIFGY